jgi:type IV/VI secretion system ImpK/VasF family protein
MTLLELCEPLFQLVCRTNRSVRKNVAVDAAGLRAEIKQLMKEMREKASRERLTDQFEKIELALIYFMDSMILENGGALAKGWDAIQKERGKMVGDDQFWDLLDETLADTTEAATERLTVFYHCVGLGFTGAYNGQNDVLKRYMSKMQARVRSAMDVDQSARLSPEAYEHVNTANLITPAGRSMVPIIIALVGTVLVMLAANVYFFKKSSSDLAQAIKTITQANSIDGGVSEAPKADAPKADAPKLDAPKTDAPKTDATKTDSTTTDGGGK